ncbi:MAG TPA: alkaline phosphatase family protein [Planctomycetaceae bacterium]|jgi:predicted AlkP superfamily pyrophosphatase or phosphodiesterase|nr:alkaline phosphatase family protein [Planctomycetaceae bacterium]
MKRLLLCAFFLCTARAIAGSASAADDPPKLVVVVSVDQFAYEYLERFRAGFDDRGIVRRCEREGAWYTNCHHRHGVTTTAPGHSVQLTGAYPSTNGIVDNGWIDRSTGKQIYCVADPKARLVGPFAGDQPVSPRNLLSDTLGDRLKIITAGRSKVFGVSIKDRAAILMTGHAGDGAFWMAENGKWITSNYYRDQLPSYLESWNASEAGARFAGKSWDLLYDRSRYQHTPGEDHLGERPSSGMKAGFPHRIPEATSRNYVRLVAYSPFGIEATLEIARLMLTDEKLGQDEYPDVLAINLSSNDYVGHTFGPESLEVEDITYRTDRMLGEFADFINDKLQGRPWLFVLTADHGVAPIPERTARLKIAAQRDPLVLDGKSGPGPAHQMLEAHLREKLGLKEAQPSLVQAVIESQIYLRDDHPAFKGTVFAEAQRLTRDWLLAQPRVAAAITREQILSGGLNGPLEAALRRSFHPRRSGDVLFCLEPYDIEGDVAATHGSPWDYDTHVPLLVLEQGNVAQTHRVPAGRFNRRVSPACIAPTLAELLHVPPPGGCVEEPLFELLPQRTSRSANSN